MNVFVFDVGGTAIKYSMMDETLRRSDVGSVPTPSTTLQDFLDTLAGIYAPYREKADGIAVSLPGFIDREKGVVRGGGALTYNYGQPIGPLLSEACGGCRVVLENDGKAAAMAELASGCLQGCQNAAVFIIGTGVGGGLIVDGKVVRGRHSTAGEFSFVNVNMHNWSDFSDFSAMRCSTTSLLKAYRAKKGLPEDAPLDGRGFFDSVNGGDPDAMEVLEQFARAIAIQAYNLTVLLDIEKLAVGGGISKQPVLIEKIHDAYQTLIEEFPAPEILQALPRPEIVACRYTSEANQVGAFYSYLQ